MTDTEPQGDRRFGLHEPTLVGTTPHTLRRTVASLIAYEFGLDAARMQLGHSLLGTTPLARYVAHREEVSDYTSALEANFITDTE